MDQEQVLKINSCSYFVKLNPEVAEHSPSRHLPGGEALLSLEGPELLKDIGSFRAA